MESALEDDDATQVAGGSRRIGAGWRLAPFDRIGIDAGEIVDRLGVHGRQFGLEGDVVEGVVEFVIDGDRRLHAAAFAVIAVVGGSIRAGVGVLAVARTAGGHDPFRPVGHHRRRLYRRRRLAFVS